MIKSKLLKIVCPVMALALCASGMGSCQPNDDTKPEVKIVMAPYFGSWLCTYGVAEGIITSEEVSVVVDQSPRFDDQMMAGNYPIGAMNTAAFAIGVDKSTRGIQALGLYLAHTGIEESLGVSLLYSRAGSDIESPGELAGKKIGVPGLQSGITTTFLQMLEAEYQITESQLTLVDNSPPQLIEFLRRGDIDAAILLGDPAVQTYYNPEFDVLWNLDHAFEQKYGTYNPASFLAVQTDYMESNPDTARAVYELLLESKEYGENNLVELSEKYVAEFGGDAEFYQNAYRNHYSVTFAAVEDDLADSVMAIFEFVYNRGIIDYLPDPADMFVKW